MAVIEFESKSHRTLFFVCATVITGLLVWYWVAVGLFAYHKYENPDLLLSVKSEKSIALPNVRLCPAQFLDSVSYWQTQVQDSRNRNFSSYVLQSSTPYNQSKFGEFCAQANFDLNVACLLYSADECPVDDGICLLATPVVPTYMCADIDLSSVAALSSPSDSIKLTTFIVRNTAFLSDPGNEEALYPGIATLEFLGDRFPQKLSLTYPRNSRVSFSRGTFHFRGEKLTPQHTATVSPSFDINGFQAYGDCANHVLPPPGFNETDNPYQSIVFECSELQVVFSLSTLIVQRYKEEVSFTLLELFGLVTGIWGYCMAFLFFWFPVSGKQRRRCRTEVLCPCCFRGYQRAPESESTRSVSMLGGEGPESPPPVAMTEARHTVA